MDLAWGLGTPLYILIDEMPLEELSLWQYWLSKEPRTYRRGDWQAASIAQCVNAVGQSFSKSPKKIQLDKFLLDFTQKSPEENAAANLSKVKALFPGLIPEEDTGAETG